MADVYKRQEEDIAQALSRGLRKHGYAVDWAPDGTEGWTLYQINQYDLIILDLNLPGLSGMEVLQKIRAQDEEIKVLILSARYHVDDKVLGLNEGANAVSYTHLDVYKRQHHSWADIPMAAESHSLLM